MSARCPAISARRRRRISSSLLPLNIGPQTTSSQPPARGCVLITRESVVGAQDDGRKAAREALARLDCGGSLAAPPLPAVRPEDPRIRREYRTRSFVARSSAPVRSPPSVARRAPDVRVRVAGREAQAPVEPVRRRSLGPRRELDRDRARVAGDPLCLLRQRLADAAPTRR